MTSNATAGALPPPPGVTPNFTNPESIAYRIIIASVLGPVITIPICIVRLYTKKYILRNVGYDDCETKYIFVSMVHADHVLDAIVLATVRTDL